jgi:predicted ATP-grasp superfamily ATP-dependent carboligase
MHEKPDGQRCGGRAMKGSDYCYGHEPSKAIERREAAIKAGRSGGRGRPRARSKELSEVKQGVRSVIEGVYEGQLDKGSAAVLLQGLNTLLRAVEMEHAAREAEEQKERIEKHLEQMGATW